MKAFTNSHGRISFGPACPPDHVEIADAPSKILKSVISRIARHGHDPGVLLVPGMPEVDGFIPKLRALEHFRSWSWLMILGRMAQITKTTDISSFPGK